MDLHSINHITFAVRDLERSFTFYTEVLGAKPAARWNTGSFLTLGGVWLALLQGKPEQFDAEGYSHIAFSIAPDAFRHAELQLREAGAKLWSENSTPGDSCYFTDPDGHRLEIHASNLAARLEALDANPPAGYQRFR